MPILGQHFLKSKAIVRAIVDAADLQPTDTVLEIGPGKGILTKRLLESAMRVVSVEKDPSLTAYMREHFAPECDSNKLELIEGDAREIDFQKFGLESGNFHIVSNLPYYITGNFLRRTLSGKIQPKKITLLLQREVANRIARNKKESLLSLSVKAYGDPHYIKTVPAKLFAPAPDVDSAIITIDNISKRYFEKVNEKHFFDILHAGFAHKRKKLSGNLAILADKGRVEKIFSNFSIDINIRAEDLPISSWLMLSSML